jgi:hypothetical protein
VKLLVRSRFELTQESKKSSAPTCGGMEFLLFANKKKAKCYLICVIAIGACCRAPIPI